MTLFPSRRHRLPLAAALLSLWAIHSLAQNRLPAQAYFQFATLTGSGNSLTVSRLPVLTGSGATIFKNLSLQFEVDPDGNLALAGGQPQVTDVPTLLTAGFRAGSYVGPGSVYEGKTPAFVDGPTALNGGATSWSFTTAPGADACTYPSSATWYVGPIKDNPVAARLEKAGITSSGWSYGVANGPGYYQLCSRAISQFLSNSWSPGTLVGVSQSGNSITIASFTDYFAGDKSAPVAQITYRLNP